MLARLARKLFSPRFAPLPAASRAFPNLLGEESWRLDAARARGSYAGLDELRARDRAEVVEETLASGLRGRGGAAFPTGRKWQFLPAGAEPYLVINADEGEPGTSKDRHVLLRDPHRLIHGALIACHAIGARAVFVYVRGEYAAEIARLAAAVEEARAAGLLGRVTIAVHPGAGAYVCGEETALLESLEGKAGRPRAKPPFPAQAGLYGRPTVVNNVETIAALPAVMRLGGAAYRRLGAGASGGTKLFTVSGAVQRPGVFEERLGVGLAAALEHYCGGFAGEPLCVFPGGLSTPPLTKAEALRARLSYEALDELGSALGTGGVIVVPDSASLVDVLERLASFYAHESCRQCPACAEGTAELERLAGQLRGAPRAECEALLDRMLETCRGMQGTTICALAGACAAPVAALVGKFRARIVADARRE
eukprot:gnl/Chilomastix_cuspidata/2299.p3 GENE.gnl/Chilomastix_cuspidata/2299~~gnl/Chilomastix_cuspidata/2299.p3  ORF type:complete len:424 (-),score=259.49 gnl/Chilomastix_cuspidata/2299:12-1283(-)